MAWQETAGFRGSKISRCQLAFRVMAHWHHSPIVREKPLTDFPDPGGESEKFLR